MTDPRHLSVERAVSLLRERFLNRTDRLAVLAPWGKLCPASCNGSLDALLAAHLIGSRAPEVEVICATRKGPKTVRGRFRVGTYAPDGDGKTRWLCLDLDGWNHPLGLVDPQAAALAAHRVLVQRGLPAYLERSGSAAGWHLWVLFDPPVPAGKARALGLAIAPAGLPLTGGGQSDPKLGRGLEIFPKQSRISEQGCGNAVWLPGWHGATPGGNLFYQLSGSGVLERHTPHSFETIAENDLEGMLEELGTHEEPPAESVHESAPNPAWVQWRANALRALSLDAIYGEWLTGEVGEEGWLKCRDPESPSGDRDPSAGVADGSGDNERGSFHSFISGRTLSVFDFLIGRARARDFREACTLVAELSGVPPPTQPRNIGVRSRSGDRSAPIIAVNSRQLRDTVREAWEAVHAANHGPHVFQRMGTLVRIVTLRGTPRIDLMGEDAVFGHLARIASWVRTTEQGQRDSHPDRDTTRDMMTNPDTMLPYLDRIVFAPVFATNGTLLSSPGFDLQSHLWLHLDEGLVVPQVPENPGRQVIATARQILVGELLGDFPFAAESDRAHAIASMLLQFIRGLLRGPTPIHLIESPTPGSGKGLLADLVSLLFLGRVCQPTTIAHDEDESRKKITSLLVRGQPVILIDNVRGVLDSSQIASAITAEVWSDRILGESRMVDLPNSATWIVTANNPRLSLEIARRCVRIRLDPRIDRPWQRTGFKHPKLKEWASAHRADLIWALLVLVRAWIVAGRPPGHRSLGSFESYASVIGGILEGAEIPGFLGDVEQLYEQADAEGREWRAFVNVWWATHGGVWVSAGDLHRLANDKDLIGQVLGEKNDRSQKIRLGKALQSVRDRQFGSFRVISEPDTNAGAARYRLVHDPGNSSVPT